MSAPAPLDLSLLFCLPPMSFPPLSSPLFTPLSSPCLHSLYLAIPRRFAICSRCASRGRPPFAVRPRPFPPHDSSWPSQLSPQLSLNTVHCAPLLAYQGCPLPPIAQQTNNPRHMPSLYPLPPKSIEAAPIASTRAALIARTCPDPLRAPVPAPNQTHMRIRSAARARSVGLLPAIL